jgi:hypothetical protein
VPAYQFTARERAGMAGADRFDITRRLTAAPRKTR